MAYEVCLDAREEAFQEILVLALVSVLVKAEEKVSIPGNQEVLMAA
jgi:hypothetical protein|tara:strand:+ start:308 stop:445 length:138 start_codon:yes stop_codon:yes gene_type:complete